MKGLTETKTIDRIKLPMLYNVEKFNQK